ncbi:MAG: hypothetical protein H7338_23110 [Candidatus Sericytochromatia bacterium]|nr:hypothetical protein [Candidatus Sericytochromatia bacterium]
MGRAMRLAALAGISLLVPGCFFLLLLAPKTTADALPDRPDKAVYVKRCSTCHALIEPRSYRHRLGEIIDRYVDKKIISVRDKESLIGYLATFPDNNGRMLPLPTPTPTPGPTAAPEESPQASPPAGTATPSAPAS